MPIKTTPFDASEFLERPEAQAEFLAEAFETGSSAYIAHALGVIARARGMTEIAEMAGLSRESLYRALSEDGDPRLSTVMGVTKAMGLKFSVSAEGAKAAVRGKAKRGAKKAA